MSADRSRFGSRWDPETDEVRNPDPYDFADFKRALARSSRDMTAAADFRVECAQKHAEAEQAYRIALADKIVRLHADDGVAWTVAQDVARGDERVAFLRRERDVAEGMKDAAEQLSWKSSADRRGVERLGEWSMRVNLGGDWPEVRR